MGLVRKFTLVLLAGIAVIFAAETVLSVRQFVAFFDADVRRDLQAIAYVLGKEIQKSWEAGGEEVAQCLVQEADSGDPTLRLSWITFQVGRTGDPSSQLDPLLHRFRSGEGFVRAEGEGDGMVHGYLPVEIGGELVGAIRVSESAAAKHDFVRARILQRASTAAAMFLLLGGLAWIASSRLVGRPVQRLVQQARRIGSGDFSARLELSGPHELAQLAGAMNAMAEELEQSRRDLEAQTAARLEAVEQVRHANRLKTVGTLAAGVAHELGTPLAVVSGRAQMIAAGEVSSPEETVETARAIRTHADRMAKIVRQLLDFARRRTPEMASADLDRLVRDTTLMLQPLAKKRQVSLEFASDIQGSFCAVVDTAQLGQAVTNLVVNALEVTPKLGRVEVRLAREKAAPTAAAPRVPCACIAVTDEGPGIPEEHLAHLFDPFFTTKEVGEGTGLGLAVAHGIVSEHGGWIDVRTARGSGSSFRIYLPQEPSPRDSSREPHR